MISDSLKEDKWRLDVQYQPVVTLRMGSTLNPDDIKEGDDVYFECRVRANPKEYKLSWFKDVSKTEVTSSSGEWKPGRKPHNNYLSSLFLLPVKKIK